MSTNQNKDKQAKTIADENPEIMDTLDTEEVEFAEANAELDENVKLLDELDSARAQIEKDKNDYLLLAAEFDNYRKRTLREKSDLIKNAAERTLLDLLPIVDDFERGIAATVSEDADDVRKGMELIYNKLIKYLESKGVKAIETTGLAFDAEIAEAIALVPAQNEEDKGKVLDTTVKGYTINDKVLRHAKVVVAQ